MNISNFTCNLILFLIFSHSSFVLDVFFLLYFILCFNLILNTIGLLLRVLNITLHFRHIWIFLKLSLFLNNLFLIKIIIFILLDLVSLLLISLLWIWILSIQSFFVSNFWLIFIQLIFRKLSLLIWFYIDSVLLIILLFLIRFCIVLLKSNFGSNFLLFLFHFTCLNTDWRNVVLFWWFKLRILMFFLPLITLL